MAEPKRFDMVLKKIVAKPGSVEHAVALAGDIAVSINRHDMEALADFGTSAVPVMDSLPKPESENQALLLIRGILIGLHSVAAGVEGHARRQSENAATEKMAREKQYAELLAALVEKPLTNQEAARAVGISESTASRKLRELEEHDLVHLLVRPDGADKRQKLYSATAVGKRLARKQTLTGPRNVLRVPPKRALRLSGNQPVQSGVEKTRLRKNDTTPALV